MLKNFLIKISYIILGAIIVAFILYIRVLRDALPTDLRRNLYAQEHYFPLIIYGLLFLLFSYFSLIIVKSLLLVYYEIGTEQKSNKFLEILAKLSNIYGESLDRLAQFICDITPIHKHLSKICVKFGLFLKKHCLTYNRLLAIIVLTHILPKSIFLGAFIVDVMIFHKFEYVYKVSFLMLIPLIEHSLHYFLIDDFCKTNFFKLDEAIEIQGLTTNNIISSEEYFKHCLVIDYKLESKRYPLEDAEFGFGLLQKFHEEHPTSTITHIVNDFLYKIIPIATFNFFYILKKQKLLAYFHAIFFLGYASIWFYMLVYCW